MSINVTIDQLKEALARKEAPFFTGELNLNLIGIRAKDLQPNAFNDVLCVVYEQNERPVLETYPITTDPGLYYRRNPIHVDGTAILAPGHYPRCWAIGMHRGKYPALVQRGLMTVYRDNNKNPALDTGVRTQTGYFGINLHRASENKYTLAVDKWSAGCQVFASADDFAQVMALCNQAAKKYGRYFSYTLLDEKELP
jgi:hypothetical protein